MTDWKFIISCSFSGRVRPTDFKSWYSQLPCLTFSI